jgi:hypothetical protein
VFGDEVEQPAGQLVVVDPSGLDVRCTVRILDGELIYAALTRNGLTPALFQKLKPLEVAACPFAKRKSDRWSAGLTAAKMVDCW